MIRINLLPAELDSAPTHINPAIPLSVAFHPASRGHAVSSLLNYTTGIPCGLTPRIWTPPWDQVRAVSSFLLLRNYKFSVVGAIPAWGGDRWR